MQPMLLVLKRGPEQESALRRLLDDQQDKGSPNYHKWLTPEQFGNQFGPADSDLQTVTAWLQSHGFQVAAPSQAELSSSSPVPPARYRQPTLHDLRRHGRLGHSGESGASRASAWDGSPYLRALTPAAAHWPSCSPASPERPMAPTSLPSTMIGRPPSTSSAPFSASTRSPAPPPATAS
jgi:pro-kumamolisin-like protein